jgi:hypothetical protein
MWNVLWGELPVLSREVNEDATMSERFDIRAAARGDVAAIHAMVRELAEYEKLTHLCVSTAAQIEQELFGIAATPRP